MTGSPLKRILVVEDNPGDALILRVMLEDSDLEADDLQTVSTLAEAVHAVSHGESPLILLDLSLPDSWGSETYLAMREAATESPIVILSGLSDEAVALELVREGAQDYLVKGQFDAGLLVRVIRYAWERQRIEKELVRRQVWSEAVIQAIPDAVVITDRSHRVVYVNSAARKLWNADESALLGRDFLSLFPPDAPDRQRLVGFLFGEPGRGTVPFQTTVYPSESAEITCDVHHSSFAVGDEELDVVVLRDLSERKRLEVQLAQAQKMDAIGQLSAGVAHDFNNLLGVVVGNLDLIKTKLGSQPDLERRIETAISASRRGAELTKQLLSFSRSRDLRPQTLALGPKLQSFLDMARRTVGPDIRIEANVEPDLPDVFADPSELENALLNLTVNARDAMPQGGLLLFTAEETQVGPNDVLVRADSLQPGPYVVLAATDTGTGISPEILEKVFDPFFTTKDSGKGTGLGLAMVYGFAKQSGGTVRLYSEVGTGTAVRLYLPVSQGAEAADAQPLAVSHRAPPGAVALVVDDEPALLEVSSRYLADLGYEVVSAPNGPAALSHLREGRPISLLVTDVLMPGGMNGQQLASMARDLVPSLKVVFTSGFPAQAFADKNLLLDSVMIPKPFVGDDLVRALVSLEGT